MNGWRGWGDGQESGPDRTKVSFAAGAGLGLLVLCWMHFARAGDERISSSGFSEGGAAVAASPFSRERRAQTDLAPSLNAEPADSKEMAAAGLPTDQAGLKRLGSNVGMLTDAIARLIDQPKILKALFDNKAVVGALMESDASRRVCSDAGALQSALSSPSAGQYTGQMMGLVSSVLSRPDTAAALAGSEMGARLMSCPSVHALAGNPSGLRAIAASNPQALTMVSDPRFAQALSSSAQGAPLLAGVQSSWSSGVPGR